MTGHAHTEVADRTGGPVVLLACTACQLVYQPDPAAFGSGNTGCPRCGGWTWIAHLGATPTSFSTIYSEGVTHHA